MSGCLDFPEGTGTCRTNDGTGLWCDNCLSDDLPADDVILNAYVEWANMDTCPSDDLGTFIYKRLREAGWVIERESDRIPVTHRD